MRGARQARSHIFLPPSDATSRATSRVARPALSAVWAAAAVGVPTAIVGGLSMSTIDLGYALEAGRRMLATGSILRTDPWLLHGGPWLNQAWAAELAFGLAHRSGGWFGLAALRSGLAAAVLGFTYLAAKERAGSSRLAAGWTLLAAATWPFALRAQAIGMLCFAVTLWALVTSDRGPWRVWLVPAVVLVWTQSHGSFPLAFVLLAVAPAASVPIRRRLQVALASAAATFVGPFGPRVWTYVFDLLRNPVLGRVEEWRPPGLGTYVGIAFWATLAISAVLVWRHRERARAALPSLLVFGAIAAVSTRGVAWWSLAMPVALAGVVPQRRAAAEPDRRSPLHLALAVAFSAIAALSLLRWLPYRGAEPPYRMLSFAPPGVTAALEERLAPDRPLFAAQEWASWFEHAVPGHRFLVDARFELVSEGTWDTYDAIAAAEPGWSEWLAELGLDAVAASRERQGALVRALAASEAWDVVYADADGVVAVRTGAG